MTILGNRLPDAPARPAAAAAAGPESGASSSDPRARLESFFDVGTLKLLIPPDTSGVLAGTGCIDGMPAVAFASDPRIQGGAMGSAGLRCGRHRVRPRASPAARP